MTLRRRFKAEKQLHFLYDHQADVLSICAGQAVYTDSIPLDENVILRVDPATQAIVGFSIVDFLKRFANTEMPASVPLMATFECVKKKPMPSKARRAKT